MVYIQTIKSDAITRQVIYIDKKCIFVLQGKV
ncbi:MAG: hypothetical protein [Podoviridae sp. cty5g4]|nr:MAG: hypothetical protein [Podoviridae sp. cty5g4]